MKTSEILALIGAGYTKAEIDAMDSGDAVKPEETKPAETAKADEAKPASAAADPNEALLNAINNLTAIVQKSNIRNSAQPAEAVDGGDIKKDVDGVLLNLYNN